MVNCLDFGRFLAGAAREKSSNCVSPMPNGSAVEGGPGRLLTNLEMMIKAQSVLRETFYNVLDFR